MGVSEADFRKAMGQFPSGVTVVTTRDALGRTLGLTVSSFCSLSLVPPLVLVCIDARSEANAGLAESKAFGASVLSEGQEEVSRRFARTGPEKFSGFPMEEGELGVSLIPGALAHIECTLRASHGAGDHVIHVGEIVRLRVFPGKPLVYHAGTYHRLGEQ